MTRQLCALLMGLTWIWTSINAQDNALVTDRPDQTESSSTVGKGAVQIETGLVLTTREVKFFTPSLTEKNNDYATTLVRVGILEDVEIRFISAYTRFDNGVPGSAVVSGLQPLSVGVKFKLAEERGAWPEVAFLGHVTLPWIGEDAFVPDFIAPDFRFSLAHTLSDRFSLGYNLGMSWDGSNARASFLYTIALGAAVIGPIGAFVELYGDVPEKLDWRHNLDFGLTVLLTPDLQFDASYGFPLDPDIDEHFFSAGVSFRFASRKVVEIE